MLWGEIDHDRSAVEFPESYEIVAELLHSSGKKLVWKCDNPLHESWAATVNKRHNGRGCPSCAGRVVTNSNRLSVKFPEVSSEWDYDLNGNACPDTISYGSHKRIHWVCGLGHKWDAPVYSRTSGVGCPYCAGKIVTDVNRLSIKFPELAEQWDYSKNGNLTPRDVPYMSHKKIHWICGDSHTWEASIYSRSGGNDCPKCAKRTSRIEKRFIETFTEQTDFTVTAHGMRLNQLKYASGYSGVEVDMIFYYNHHYLLVEYDGNYWHRDRADSDMEKSRLLLSLGDNILHARIREDNLPELDLAHDRFAQFRHDYHASESDSIEETVRKIESWFLEKIGE